jgi:hypothetical protein
MRSRVALLALLVSSLGILAPRASRGELVDRILAVVDERPLLLSTVRALENVRGLEGEAALEGAIDERLMFQEASRLPQTEVTGEEEEAALGSMLEARPELATRIPPADLRRLVRRQLAILKYIEFRFRPQIRITEDAVREAWNEALHGPPFEEAAPELRARLEREDLDRRIENWVKDLRARAEVRYVEGPGPPSTGERASP